MGLLGPRTSHPASQLWIRCSDSFTILHNERGQKRHGNYINGFFKRNLVHSNLVILKKKWCGVLITLNLLSGIFLFFYNKRDQEVHENFIGYFLRKNLIWGNLLFSDQFLMLDWVWSKLLFHCYYWIFRKSGHYF